MPSPLYESPSAEDAPGGILGAIAQLGLAAYMVLLLTVAGSAILCTGLAWLASTCHAPSAAP
ncbi:MAG: hypothetical protein IPN01_12820 [Deltaproteobacteria bacterium]|nr:hypothetical protein [Deltaproteobacteria bacterium]